MPAPRPSVLTRWIVPLVLVAGCGAGTRAPPEAGYRRGGVPQLEGLRVAVFPVQIREGGHPELDREIEFAFTQVGPGVDWVFPDQLREAMERNPGTELQIVDLQVRSFLAGELRRVGDPLFGNLYRVGAVTGASYGILPVFARDRAREPAGAVETGRAVEIAAALVDLRSGNVTWYGIVEGGIGEPGDIATSAAAADALARTLFP